jgi:hypothetical protein
MNDFDHDDDDDDDGDDDDEVLQNHFLYMEYHQKMMMVEVQMDRMVLLKPLIMVDHYDIVNNTYHYIHHPTENSPFDNIVVKTNLEIRRRRRKKQNLSINFQFLTDLI